MFEYKGMRVYAADIDPGTAYLVEPDGPMVLAQRDYERMEAEMAKKLTGVPLSDVYVGDKVNIGNVSNGPPIARVETDYSTRITPNGPVSAAITTTDATWGPLVTGGSGERLDAEELAKQIHNRFMALGREADDIKNGYSWMQLGYCQSDMLFTNVEEAIEHAQGYALQSMPVTIYREGESDGDTTAWAESLTYDWNANMRLVFQPDPRTKTDLQKCYDQRACASCENTHVLRPNALGDALYCRLCGKRHNFDPFA